MKNEEQIKRAFKHCFPKKDYKSVHKLAGDASTREYYRILATEESFIYCLQESFSDENDFLTIHKLFKKNKISVPDVFGVFDKDGGVLQQDLGDTSLLIELGEMNKWIEIEKIYKMVIDEILKIQSIPIAGVDEFIKKRSFDKDKLSQEVAMTCEFFIKEMLGVRKKNIDSIQEHWESICQKLGSASNVLCHRDLHSRNVMLLKEQLYLIDFQDARMGRIQYDLVSLLEDCYTDISPIRESLITYYKTRAIELGIVIENDFDEIYNMVAIQRIFKAIGSFAYLTKVKDTQRYLKNIGHAMEKMKILMMKESKLSNLFEEIYRHYYAS